MNMRNLRPGQDGKVRTCIIPAFAGLYVHGRPVIGWRVAEITDGNGFEIEIDPIVCNDPDVVRKGDSPNDD